MLTSTIARSQRVLFVVRLILAGALIAVAIIVALVAPAATASAAPAVPTCSNTITVMNGNDSGAGSLRQAIADVCDAGTIYFDHDMTVTLASQLVINRPLTIEGQEKRVTISGNHVTRVVSVDAVGDVHLNRLTIANGWAGNDNGGGIKNVNSYLWLDSCLLTGNATNASGGAIYDNEFLKVQNSTLTGNKAGSTGGAIFSDSQANSLVLDNVTITLNLASYAGGVSNAGAKWAALVNNTIIAGQTTGVNCDMWSATGSGNNLSNSSSCSGGFTKSDAILLGSLGGYGGVTRSIPLLPGSLAIDGGQNCAGGGFDQRGFPRVGRCDIGAFESQGFNLTVAGGNNQSASLNAEFATPLSITIAPKQPGEPVNGGQITFTAPPSGASASLTGTPATISGGGASVVATANETAGAYSVTASTRGAADATLSLTNLNVMSVSVAGPGTYSFGSTGVTIVVNSTANCLSGITVARYDENHPQATNPLKTGHWWGITAAPSGCSGFSVDLTLPTDFPPDTTGLDKVCYYTGTGTVWNCAWSASGTRSITRNGVTHFSEWAVGRNVGPTAVRLSGLHGEAAAPRWLGAVAAFAGALALARFALGRIARAPHA